MTDTPSSSQTPEPAPKPAADTRGYWRANLRNMAILLVVWFLASFVLGILLVQPLNSVRLGGFPLGFWFAQQGAIYVFVVLIWIYARRMDHLDRRYGVDR